MSDFDFIKGFAGVNILEAEAVAAVVGRVTAALFKGMTEGGMSDVDAHQVIRSALDAAFVTMRPPS